MGSIATWLLSTALGPLLNTGLDGYKAKLASVNSHEAKQVELAGKAMELDAREAKLNNDEKALILGRWYAPENLFAYAIAFPYWFTVITMDYLIFPALGIEHSTDPLKGDTAVIMMMIMTFWFGKRALTTVTSIIAGAFGKR